MGSILFILRNAQYFHRFDTVYTRKYTICSGVDTANTKQYAAFSAVGFLYSALRRNSGGYILLMLGNTQHYSGVDAAYTNKYVEFWGGG